MIFVKLRGEELRKRDDNYSCSSEGNMLSVSLETKVSLRHGGLARVKEG